MDLNDFAEEWETAWNAHDLSRILGHYTEDVVFLSRKAEALTGNGKVMGKAALGAYWSHALKLQPNLRFEVIDAFMGHQMMVITYRSHNATLAAETLVFDELGLVRWASACHRLE